MIDLRTEKLVPLAKFARDVFPGGVHISTLHRWRRRGIRGIKIETCVVGGRRYSTFESALRFIAATTAAANGEQCAAATPTQRQHAIRQAEAELDSDGF